MKHTGVDHEIIVVDGGSQDDSARVVRTEFPTVKLVALTENHGFGKACNIGVQHSQNPIEFGFIKVNRRSQIKIGNEVPMLTFYASGGSVAYSKEKYLLLGGFDEIHYPFYWEDTDLSYQAWKRGWKVLYQPQSVAYHKNQGTIGKSFKRSYIKEIYWRHYS